MTQPEYDQAQMRIDSITSDLRNYAITEGSDSVRIQNLRAFELHRSSEQLEKLIWDVKELEPEGRLALTVGDEPVDVECLNRAPYDFYSSTSRTIGRSVGPRDTLVFDDADRWTCDEYGRREVYLRDGMMHLSTSGLAKALVRDGSLTIIEKDLAQIVSRATWQASR